MWDLPGPGLEPMSPALAGGFLTTAPPGKPLRRILYYWTTREVPRLVFIAGNVDILSHFSSVIVNITQNK